MTKAPSFTVRHKAVLDAACRLSLAVFFAYCAGIYGRNAYRQLQEMANGFDIAYFCKALAIFAVCLYTVMLAFVYILRTPAVNKFAGWWPAFAALLGGFMGMGLALFKPRDDLPLEVQLTASILILVGSGLAAYVLSQLGQSFSILPESRNLVTSGPYRIVRHPLYAVEALATIGALLNFWSSGAVLLVGAQLAFQIVRMHYEEKVLSENFPEYADYKKRTARLIPGIY